MSWREQPREPKPLQRTGKSCTEGTLTMKQEAWEGTIQERDCEEQHSTCDGPFGKARGGDSSWTAAAISEITSEVSRCKPCVRTEVGQSGFEWNINTQCHKEHNDPNRSVRSSTSNLSACGRSNQRREMRITPALAEKAKEVRQSAKSPHTELTRFQCHVLIWRQTVVHNI